MMTVISTVADPETLSLTVVAEFDGEPRAGLRCGKIPDVSSAGGDHPVIPRRLRDTISRSGVNRVIT